jgi:cytochrome oxidase Cu insertion factor (SCO1/SenC/PrrC family)
VALVRTLVVLFGLLAVFAAGCGSESGEEAAPPGMTTTTETAPPESEGGRAAPAIAGTTLDGERLALADFRGRPVLVNVWSSW